MKTTNDYQYRNTIISAGGPGDRIQKLMRRACLVGVSAASLAISAMPVRAETTKAAPEASAGIEEITVTARKRTEDLQKVPVAVSAFSGKMLENLFVADVRQLGKYIPNVQLGQVQFSGATMMASIRGISFSDIERSFEPAVAVAIDGVFLATNTGALVDMFDVDSIEVLRGPQGTLFGRNTIGGVIDIHRTRPTGEYGAKLDATFGSYGRNDYKAILNAPIVPGILAAKLGVFSLNSDSFTRNYYTGQRDPGVKKLDVEGSLLFTPNEKFEALLTYEHMKDRSHYPQEVNLSLPGSLACDVFSLCFTGIKPILDKTNYTASFSAIPFYTPMDSDNVTLNMKLKQDQYTIESVTGYMKNKDSLDIDNIGGPTVPGTDRVLFHPIRHLHGDQFSEELRYISNFSGIFNVVAGLYYFQSSYELDRQEVYVFDPVAHDPSTLVSDFSAGQKVKSYAAFAETYWQILDDTRLTIGGRYTHENKKFHMTVYNQDPARSILFTCPDPTLVGTIYDACRNPDVTFSKFTPRISLDHNLAKDVMVYATWARGFRSGGWNGRGQTPTTIGPYQPEQVDNYELGFRSKFLDNKALFNATVFQTNYKNKQEDVIRVSPLNPASTETTVLNASSVRIKGVELEAQLRPVRDLNLFASAGYLDAKFLNFFENGVDVKANRNLRYAPKWNLSFGGDYTLPVGGAGDRIVFGGNVKYVAKLETNLAKDPSIYQRDVIPAHTSVDASITYHGTIQNKTNYKVSAFINDAFHDGGRIYRSSDAGVFWFGDRMANRTVGLETQLEF